MHGCAMHDGCAVHAINHKVIVTCDWEDLVLPSACNFNDLIFDPVLLIEV